MYASSIYLLLGQLTNRLSVRMAETQELLTDHPDRQCRQCIKGI